MSESVRLRSRGGTFAGSAREVIDTSVRELARPLLCDYVFPNDEGECALHLRGLPSRTKIQELHRDWFAKFPSPSI